MSEVALFSSSYVESRERFVAAAAGRGVRVRGHRNDRATGPGGEELWTDVAVLPGRGGGRDGGRDGAGDGGRRALVLVSGTHGAEAFAGAACQLQLLAGVPAVPDDLDVVLVHALNPFGFAHGRRVNEGNVDVNRNFVDHADPPRNPRYADVHDALVPADWGGPAHAAADARLAELAGAWGLTELQTAVTHGQYTHPDGLFYGGGEPCWSNVTWRSIVRETLRGYEHVGYVDLHTGLGAPLGVEPIFRGGRDPGALERASAWYGPALTHSEAGTSSSTPIDGNTARALAEELPPETLLTAITLEFGTQAGLLVLGALRADNWVWQHRGEATDEQRAEARRLMTDAFAPTSAEWREAALRGGERTIAAAIDGLCR